MLASGSSVNSICPVIGRRQKVFHMKAEDPFPFLCEKPISGFSRISSTTERSYGPWSAVMTLAVFSHTLKFRKDMLSRPIGVVRDRQRDGEMIVCHG